MIYLDNAATTRPCPAALDAMRTALEDAWGNPSALYRPGQQARKLVEDARRTVARVLHAARPAEITFTSGGTESDVQALYTGAALGAAAGKRHIISTQIEHHAVLHTCQQLEKEGFEVTYLPVDEFGLVRPEELEKALRPETTVVSIMYANNEIGTIEPIAELCRIARAHGALFHTDAVQAVGHVPIDVKALDVDMLSLSGHKLHAPKGVGALYIRKGLHIQRFMEGGAQERNQRAGTENVASIVAMGAAIELAVKHLGENVTKIAAMRDHLAKRILTEIPYTRLNGHPEQRLPGNVNVCFRFIEGEALLLSLDLMGIAGSSGSACTSGSLDPSHVLLAIGLPHEIAHGSLRLSLSEENTMEEVDYVVEALKKIVERLRAMSPLYDEFCKAQEG